MATSEATSHRRLARHRGYSDEREYQESGFEGAGLLSFAFCLSLCGVGCGQLVYHNNAKLVAIEGDPRFCQTREGRNWICPPMDMVADRVWESRGRTFVEKENSAYVMHTLGISPDNVQNLRKLFSDFDTPSPFCTSLASRPGPCRSAS